MTGSDLAGCTVLVTGAAGFIGFHLTKRLLATGARVVGIDNMNSYYDVTLKDARLRFLLNSPAFRFEHCDITEHQKVRSLFESCNPEFVVHLAAQVGVRYSLINPRAYFSSNIDGFLTILEACRVRPISHLLYASSSSVYGNDTKVPFQESDPAGSPVSVYAATKRTNELMAETYAHLFDIPATGLRFFSVYGPWGRPDMAYFVFTKAALAGNAIDVFNNGQMRRDFTYIDDVIEAVYLLLHQPPRRAAALLGLPIERQHIIYNIGNHTPVELLEFVAMIEAAVGRTAERRYLPMQPGDVPETFADVSRLAGVTGFAPRTPLLEGIGRFVQWYKAYYGS
jgi:UDP-glucuronate 4-epimerase